MNVLGIIAEYNPFHKGHAYQIETLKQKTNADYCIIAMSGNFVQRGAPALADKYTRAQMALENGADLVLELPVLYATASAESFAMGGVSLLHRTGVVTHLGFGAENDNLSLLQKVSDILLANPPAFTNHLQKELRHGLSFPAARASALKTVLPESQDVLASPNNILAIEYLKAMASLHTDMIPCPLLRRGQGYHDIGTAEEFCSASAIRKHISEDSTALSDDSFGSSAMPDTAWEILKEYPHPLLFEDDFSQLIHYNLLTESPETLAGYADSSTDLANRMSHARHSFTSWSDFCSLLKTKNTTYTRISRMLLHIALNIKSEDYHTSSVSYLRVLGFRKTAAPLLSDIKSFGHLPLLTGISDTQNRLSQDAFASLQRDITASDIYNLALTAKGSSQLLNDYRHPLVII